MTSRYVLANVAPWVLRILMGEDEQPDTKPQGSQLKINLLLDRLPQLKSGLDPARRLRRHHAPRRGLQPAPDGVRRGGGRLRPVGDAGRDLLPLVDRSLDPR